MEMQQVVKFSKEDVNFSMETEGTKSKLHLCVNGLVLGTIVFEGINIYLHKQLVDAISERLFP